MGMGVFLVLKVRKKAKESIQSSTTPDQGHRMGSEKQYKILSFDPTILVSLSKNEPILQNLHHL